MPKIQRWHHDALGDLKGRQVARVWALEGVHGRGGAEEHEGGGGPHDALEEGSHRGLRDEAQDRATIGSADIACVRGFHPKRGRSA